MEPSPDDLHDPAFLRYLDERCPERPAKPGEQDPAGPADAVAEQAEAQRPAAAREITRMWHEWKAGHGGAPPAPTPRPGG
jgi:hypothetical protein